MQRIRTIALFTFLFISGANAQTPPSFTSSEILLQLKKLKVLGSVLYVAAHPDDENTRLLAYLSKEKLYRTGYLSMTRGDGGQNLIGDEQGIELGLIRTQELLAARRIDGAEQFFTRAYDFGFSKTTEEALQIWNKEKILSDVVWVIRKFQPDVIITRFPEDSRAGHGHHSASAVLAHEAFEAAADPKRFPEQLKYGVKPWQAKRIFWNTFNFGQGFNTTAEDQLKFDVGVYNSILGKSYGEIAAESRSNHKSQGFGIARSRGQIFEYFTLTEGSPAKTTLLDDVNTNWGRVEGGEKIEALIDEIIRKYSVTEPSNSIEAIVQLYSEISQIPNGYWKAQKLKEVRNIIEECAGLWLDATTNSPYAVQGDSVRFNFSIISRSLQTIVLKNVSGDGFDSVFNQSLSLNKLINFSITLSVPYTKPVTQPYWLQQEMSAGSFNVSDQELIGNAQGAPAYEVSFLLNINGQDIKINKPVQFKFTDPVKGEVYQPVTVLPSITASLEPDLLILNSDQAKSFNVITKAHSSRAKDFNINIKKDGSVNVKPDGGPSNGVYSYSAARMNASNEVTDATVSFENGKSQTALELKTISYEHIPRIDYFKTPKIRLVAADIKISGKRIGYIEGAGDKVPEALQLMGYEVVILKERDIRPSILSQFDAIITGVRAYNVHDYLIEKHDVLMDYIKNGGNLIVQYNTVNFGPNQRLKIGPYPFNISRNRVTDENANVKFLKPEHPVLNYPNKITPTDFEHWIQERGLYFADQPDPKYQSIFSMNDPGESPQEGSLIIADYGKGKFVYTGLVFFRELPAGVPGAYRLMANIIALNHKKTF